MKSIASLTSQTDMINSPPNLKRNLNMPRYDAKHSIKRFFYSKPNENFQTNINLKFFFKLIDDSEMRDKYLEKLREEGIRKENEFFNKYTNKKFDSCCRYDSESDDK